MLKIKNYPKRRKHVRLYVRYPVQLTKQNIQGHPHEEYFTPGMWVAANVLNEGYQIPLGAIEYASEQKCQEICDKANAYNNFSRERVHQVISTSMQNSLSKEQLTPKAQQ